MADAVCGPSNALQNFQKHASVDRTLQQDRTVYGGRSEQSFRSAAPGTGSLDSEFHAFQASQLPSAPLQRAQLPLAHITRYPTPPTQVLPQWASDFQSLNLTGKQPALSKPLPEQLSSPSGAGGWQAEFMAQRNPMLQPAQSQQPVANQWIPHYADLNPYAENTMYSPFTQQILPEQPQQIQPSFDEALFAQAFDQAKAEMDQSTEIDQQPKVAEADGFNMGFACTDPGDITGEYDFDAAQLGFVTETGTTEVSTNQQRLDHSSNQDLRDSVPEVPRIGADTIPAKAESEAINPQVEADELSRTAGHLLDTLKDEKNTKFQQSSFLALMRQLRDKEVKVEGDKMVHVPQPSAGTLHPGGRFYPYDAFSSSLPDTTLANLDRGDDGPSLEFPIVPDRTI